VYFMKKRFAVMKAMSGRVEVRQTMSLISGTIYEEQSDELKACS